jgi:hypothetical protein
MEKQNERRKEMQAVVFTKAGRQAVSRSAKKMGRWNVALAF